MANKIRRSKADVAFTVVDNLLLGLVLIIVLYPLWFILIASMTRIVFHSIYSICIKFLYSL